jgi:hypothetical protein
MTRKPRQAQPFSNGCDGVGTDPLPLEVLGSWCDEVKSAPTRRVSFVLGHPSEVIP